MNPIERNPSILVVDDDFVSRMLISEALSDLKMNIFESERGLEALECFELNQDEISLVILDIKLPQLDGWTLLTNIRQSKPEIPAIAISALFPEEFFYKSKSAGFNIYLSKPININNFRELVKSYIN